MATDTTALGSPARLLAEFVLIVLSILVAFGVEDFREDRAEDELRTLALSNIRAELEHNISALDVVMPYHGEVAASIMEKVQDRRNWEGRRGFEVGPEFAPNGVQGPDLRTTAWETALSTGAVALFEYTLSQRIARVYDAQRRGVDATIERMVDHVFTLSTFRSDETEAVLMLIGALAGELHAQERDLRRQLEGLLADPAAAPFPCRRAGACR